MKNKNASDDPIPKSSQHSSDLCLIQSNRFRVTSFSNPTRETRRPKSGASDRESYQKMMKTMYIMSSIKKAVKYLPIDVEKMTCKC